MHGLGLASCMACGGRWGACERVGVGGRGYDPRRYAGAVLGRMVEAGLVVGALDERASSLALS